MKRQYNLLNIEARVGSFPKVVKEAYEEVLTRKRQRVLNQGKREASHAAKSSQLPRIKQYKLRLLESYNYGIFPKFSVMINLFKIHTVSPLLAGFLTNLSEHNRLILTEVLIEQFNNYSILFNFFSELLLTFFVCFFFPTWNCCYYYYYYYYCYCYYKISFSVSHLYPTCWSSPDSKHSWTCFTFLTTVKS